MGFDAYFLIVWDFVKFAKDNGIAVGPGRGSAAGSIVSYALQITDVDPLEYDLLFERFLNAERISMPDIDIDFSVKGRDRVIQLRGRQVRARVGRPDHHLRPDVPARGHARRRAGARLRLRRGRPARQADPGADHGPLAVVRRVPQPSEPSCARVYDSEARGARRSSTSRKGLEGIVRNSSIHAAAVVIADRPLTDIVPLQLAEDRGAVDRGRRALLPHGHAVLDEADRGDRPAEDGLPRPAQPRRDRGGARHHRALRRRAARHGHAAARRREDLRDARARATRSACSSSSPTGMREALRKVRPDRVRRPRRAERALPPGRHALHRHLRAQQAQPGRGHLHRRAAAPDHRVDATG